MKNAPKAVAAEIAHPGPTLRILRIRLNRVTNIAGRGTRLYRRDAAHHAFIGDFGEALRLTFHLADIIHAAGIAMPSVQNDSDIDVQNVAVFERPVAGNAVADDVIDRGAKRVTVAAIAK